MQLLEKSAFNGHFKYPSHYVVGTIALAGQLTPEQGAQTFLLVFNHPQ